MNKRQHRARSESGATAIIVGLLFVALLVIASFTTDFGMAYVSKRQLQTGADAAALAAAAEYAKYPGSCTDMVGNPDAEAEAAEAADAVWAENLLARQQGADGEITEVACRDTDGNGIEELEVVYEDQATTDGFLSGDDLTTTRLAAAAVSATESVHTGLRPYIICSDFVPEPPYPGSGYVRVDFPDEESDDGDCPHPGGNWFALDCPHVVGSNGDLAENTALGCEEPVSVVEGQDPTSPATLSASLLEACDPLEDYDQDCLSSNPGNDTRAHDVSAAWDSLVGDDIILPVFCGIPTCDPVAITPEPTGSGPGGGAGGGGAGGGGPAGGGENSLYPIHKFAGVTVCGWHWGPGNSGSYNSHPNVSPVDVDDPCYGADARPGPATENYLLLHFTNVVTTGTTGPSTCRLGDDCDTGPRRVQLTQ